MSRSVTVTGPPRAICSRNKGTTLPAESSTFPNRTAMNRVEGEAWWAAWHIFSASRLLAPMAFAGFTALSLDTEYETAGGVPSRRACHRVRAKGVYPDRLPHVVLEHRHVLVRGRVKYDCWIVALENTFHGGRVTDVGEHDRERESRVCLAQLQLQPVQVEFADIHDHETGGFDPCDLPAQLAPDGPAATGHQDCVRGQRVTHSGPVDPHRLPVQQIIDGGRLAARRA